jgi:DNA repair protein RadC
MERDQGIEGKSNRELLEQVIRPAKNAIEIIANHSISDLVHATRSELKLPPVAFERLKAAIELGRRIQESKTNYRVIRKISSSDEAIAFCKQRFSRLILDRLQEEFHIVTLNTKNHVIDTHQVSKGTLDASLVHPREVFRPAIKDAASSILLAHNHPSGDATPSREDIAVTDRLTEVGKTIGIEVLDHIVLGKAGVVSIRSYA